MISIKNVILPNKPLSNFELEDAVKKLKIPYFWGVFLLDTLPKKPNKKECGIVNFDKSGGPGKHWVTWYKNGKTKIYFESYVLPRKADMLYQRSSSTSGTSILWSFVFIRSQRTQ